MWRVEVILQHFGINGCKFVVTPGSKDKCHAKGGNKAQMSCEAALSEDMAPAYRALVARPNYAAAD